MPRFDKSLLWCPQFQDSCPDLLAFSATSNSFILHDLDCTGAVLRSVDVDTRFPAHLFTCFAVVAPAGGDGTLRHFTVAAGDPRDTGHGIPDIKGSLRFVDVVVNRTSNTASAQATMRLHQLSHGPEDQVLAPFAGTSEFAASCVWDAATNRLAVGTGGGFGVQVMTLRRTLEF